MTRTPKRLIFIFLFLLSAVPLTVIGRYDFPAERISIHGTLPSERLPSPAVPHPFAVLFSHEPGFYDESFYLTLTAPEGAVIFYTLNGSYPTTRSIRYTGPIRINAPEPARAIARFDRETISRVAAFSIRAVAFLDGRFTETATRSFITGTDVHTRFCADTLIFALNSDPHGLYDHYDGIFVAGVDRESFIENYYEAHGEPPRVIRSSPANFNRRGVESERAVHVEMFDHTGTLHISQRAGMRVKGGFSRAHEPQKSLELYAREEYGDLNQFRFAFFGDELTHDGVLMDRYRRIRLRNGGTDRYSGFIRDELSQTLFRRAGFPTTQSHRPAAVFLNGEYYGAAWLKSPRTENHLRRVYGGESERFEIVSGGETRNRSWWGGERSATADLRQVHALAAAGFTGPRGDERFIEFSRRICVESLVMYYAMQIYINNLDWPNHNIEMWRYFPTDEERDDPNLHTYLRDGKWRVFTHDLEASWGIGGNAQVYHDTINDILNRRRGRWNSYQGSAFLTALVARDCTRAMMANVFMDLISGAFAPENVLDTLDTLLAQIDNEFNYALRANTFRPHTPSWPTPSVYETHHERIRYFAVNRPQAILTSIERNLGFDRNATFSVTLTVGPNGSAVMNTRTTDARQTVTGSYYNGTRITLTARPNEGYTVDHWLVNGTRYTGEAVSVDRCAEITLAFRHKSHYIPNPFPFDINV